MLRGARHRLALALVCAPLLSCEARGYSRPRAEDIELTAVSTTTLTSGPLAAASRPPVAADGTSTLGGLRYFERVTGGAREDDSLPMIVLLHGMGLRPRMFQTLIEGFSGKARFIVPFGPLSSALGFAWFETRSADQGPRSLLDAQMPAVAEQVASALAQIRAVRPTTGRIVVGGFSQGAELTYGLALIHPEMYSRACPMSGALTPELLRRPRADGPKPEVHGFHGASDLVVRTAAGQFTIAGLSALGYVADMKLYPGVGHDFRQAADDVSACLAAGAAAASAP